VEAGFLGAHNQEEGLAACCPEEVDPYASVGEKVSSEMVDQTVLVDSNDSLKRCRNGVDEGCDYGHGLDESPVTATGKGGKKTGTGCWT
jgi:hypothetical protein